MSIRPFQNFHPNIHKSVYIDSQACIIGQVEIGKDCSVWPMVVIRGDVNFIKIGYNTNIQDGSILHVTHKGDYSNGSPLIIGNNVTIGHGAIIHACTIKNNCLIGMGATLMDDCVIESNSIIAAGSLVPPNKHIKTGELWLGNPAKKVKNLDAGSIEKLKYSAMNYVKLKNSYSN